MDILLLIIEIIGVISFSAAGAMVAISKETDLFGVVFLSVITCFGGGLLRDTIASENLPIFFTDMGMHIIVCIFVALAVFFIAKRFKRQYVENETKVEKINNVLDALGLGVFAAAGTGMYIEEGALVALIFGMLSSIGGSILRDTMLREIPFVLRKRVYAVATLTGAGVYYLIDRVVMDPSETSKVIATLTCMTVIFVIRMCATHFRWNMPKAIVFSEMAEQSADEDNGVKG